MRNKKRNTRRQNTNEESLQRSETGEITDADGQGSNNEEKKQKSAGLIKDSAQGVAAVEGKDNNFSRQLAEQQIDIQVQGPSTKEVVNLAADPNSKQETTNDAKVLNLNPKGAIKMNIQRLKMLDKEKK